MTPVPASWWRALAVWSVVMCVGIAWDLSHRQASASPALICPAIDPMLVGPPAPEGTPYRVQVIRVPHPPSSRHVWALRLNGTTYDCLGGLCTVDVDFENQTVRVHVSPELKQHFIDQ